ncbi:MAG TPA: DUF4215 domain-containing protein [Nannocystaceae bacterium]|nr:DUF4215 domain-containing protein [Nannocystaceae bacterium]
MLRYRLILVGLVLGCPSSDDVPIGGSSSEAGSSASDTSTLSTTTTVGNDTSSGEVTTLDTTCSDDCPGSSETTITTAVDSSSSGSSSDGSESSSTAPAESSSSEGPPSVCGDGIVSGSEECDDSGESASCDSDCTAASCGDTHVNTLAGETCDAGGESFGCDVDCTAPVCGDGITNSSHNEDCDDAGASATCDTDCTAPVCGDGLQNLAALETCDDGDMDDGDGCSSACLIEGDFGGLCRIVDGRQWCFDNDNCGQACDDVCTSLGLVIEPDDDAWLAAQDTLGECQAISDAFGLAAPAQLDALTYGCLEDAGDDDTVGGGLTGALTCSTDPTCPGSHRTQMDDLGGICNLPGARRSVCPCEGPFCGNGLIEPGEDCDDGNQVNNDGCTTSCLTTPPSCAEVDGIQWCYNPEICGQTCTEICDSLGLALDIADSDWSAAQDTPEECQAIADAFGMMGTVDVNSYAWACAEEPGSDDVPNMGITGLLYCSTDPFCPTAHRTGADSLGISDCSDGSAYRSLCPCN